MKTFFLSLVIFIAANVQPVFAKAAFYGPEWMIRNAAFIAIVDITRVTTNEAKGEFWTYREAATARVERVLKGALPKEVTLRGGETFICAQVRYQPGRHLVFLRRDGKLLIGVNWHLGNRPIVGQRVEWFAGENKNVHETALVPLEKVVSQIEGQLRRDAAQGH